MMILNDSLDKSEYHCIINHHASLSFSLGCKLTCHTLPLGCCGVSTVHPTHTQTSGPSTMPGKTKKSGMHANIKSNKIKMPLTSKNIPSNTQIETIHHAQSCCFSANLIFNACHYMFTQNLLKATFCHTNSATKRTTGREVQGK